MRRCERLLLYFSAVLTPRRPRPQTASGAVGSDSLRVNLRTSTGVQIRPLTCPIALYRVQAHPGSSRAVVSTSVSKSRADSSGDPTSTF